MIIPPIRFHTTYRAMASLLSPAGNRAALSVLIYHRVIPEPDALLPDVVDAATFTQQVLALHTCFNVLPLAEAIERLIKHALPERAVCLTFDDGYADNLTVAAPILVKYGLPATCFIATDYLEGGRMFNDTVIEAVRRAAPITVSLDSLGLGQYDLSSAAKKLAAIDHLIAQVKYLPAAQRLERINQLTAVLTNEPLPTDLMLTGGQVQQLAAMGIEIGAHTASHPILTQLSLTEVRDDITRGRARLESLLNSQIKLFAYPNGKPNTDYTADHIQLIQDLGFIGAVSTAWGCAHSTTDHYQLPRFTPWAKQPERFIQQLLRNLLRRQTIPSLLTRSINHH
ncbi:polysaccharide deacetylase family protein [Thiospirillum jenense]|uniref:Polysaccharide deacetylase family protein n=1 Tax=Thiospirillum jenense TaxID=1653858 RepID=A0A839H8S4_9GAMM|nr:polysaccharide deacetylase family protein [Thiospirillum jenense]MBB1125374.1 polysaccharide deacetylase family protein [Thiospirillum jenense]